MSKKQLIITLAVLVIAAIAIILLMRSFLAPELPSAEEKNPPISSLSPKSGTSGIEVWTGVLGLSDSEANLKVGDKVYKLIIPGAATAKIMADKGYQSGDFVNAMGKLKGEAIEASGINKLVK